MLLKVAVFYSLWLLLLFSCPIMSNSLQPLELQHARLLCPSSSPEVCPSLCPLHRWCHPATSSSDALFSFCLQSFPASETFQMSQLFTSIRWPKYWRFSFSFSPSDEFSELISLKIDWFVLLAVQETLRSFLQHHSLKHHNSSVLCLLYGPALTTICDHWEDNSLDCKDLCWQNNLSAFQHIV